MKKLKSRAKLFRLLSRLILDDPEFSSSLMARYQRNSLLFREGMNQLYRWLSLSVAYSLTTIGIETNNTCNLQCRHCPVPREMTRPKGLMSFSVFQKIININPCLRRIYLTDWGEPLLHPEIIEMIAYAHSRGIHVSLTTNGTLLDESMSEKLMRAGLDLIKISIDGGKQTYEKIRGFPYLRIKEKLHEFLRLRKVMGSRIWIEVTMVVYEETIGEIEPFLAEWQGKVDAINLQPRFFTLPRPTRSACRDLWRLLVVLWDGRVTPCCADYNGELIVGRANEKSLQDVFNGPAMISLRKKHLKRQWSGLCERCSFYEADYHLSPGKINEIKKKLREKEKMIT